MLARLVPKLHILILTAVILRLLQKSFSGFMVGYDYIWYHLPHALTAWGITQFKPSGYIEHIIERFPPLADLVEGFLVWVTGNINAATSANILTLGIVCFLIWFHFRGALPMRWLLTGFAAIPLVVLQCTGGYVDLFGAAGVLLAFAMLLFLQQRRDVGWQRWTCVLALAFGLFLATMSRFQTWLACGFIVAACLIEFGRRLRAKEWNLRTMLLASGLIIGVCAIWPTRNLVLFGNPVSPYKMPVLAEMFPYTIPMEYGKYRTEQSPQIFLDKNKAEIFLISLFEINRLYASHYRYSEEMSVRETDAKGESLGTAVPHFRMGGWSVFTVVPLLLMFIAGIALRVLPIIPSGLIFLMFISSAYLNHELRYFMFIPMCLFLLVFLQLTAFPRRLQSIFLVLVAVSAVHTLEFTRAYKLKLDTVSDSVGSEIKSAWAAYEASDKRNPLCVVDARGDGIFWTGPNLREYPVISRPECKGQFVTE